jgi:hypothetical protein
MSKLSEVFVLREANDEKDWKPDDIDPNKSYALQLMGHQVDVVLSALYSMRDGQDNAAVEERYKKDAGSTAERIYDKTSRFRSPDAGVAPRLGHKVPWPKNEAADAGGEQEEGETPAQTKYYEALGRFTFAGEMRDSAKDEEERQYWRDRRRKLAKVLDRVARSAKMPTATEIGKEAGKDDRTP